MWKLMYKLVRDEINLKHTSVQPCQAKDKLYSSISFY